MPIRLYSNEELDSLRAMRKTVSNPGARWTEKPTSAPAHRQRSFKATAEDEATARFDIYQRQSLKDAAAFSCGIALVSADGSRLTLARYNGPLSANVRDTAGIPLNSGGHALARRINVKTRAEVWRRLGAPGRGG